MSSRRNSREPGSVLIVITVFVIGGVLAVNARGASPTQLVATPERAAYETQEEACSEAEALALNAASWLIAVRDHGKTDLLEEAESDQLDTRNDAAQCAASWAWSCEDKGLMVVLEGVISESNLSGLHEFDLPAGGAEFFALSADEQANARLVRWYEEECRGQE